jgi:hypothetical protein
MAFAISGFTETLKGDGARPNLFKVVMTNIPNQQGSALTFLAKSAQLPGSTLGIVPLFYQGREVKFAGNRTFADWTITIINDENFFVRNAFEKWMNGINSHATNLRNASMNNIIPNASAGTQINYQIDAEVWQYGKSDDTNPIKKYNFVGMFPVDLSPIDLDWGTNDTIEEFTVTFAYQYWTSGTDVSAQ